MFDIRKVFRVVDKPEKANFMTHSGTMHADEVMATAILITYALTEKGRDALTGGVRLFRGSDKDLERVREIGSVNYPKIIEYDIGGGDYDHHDKSQMKCRENGIPYAACGLIWNVYGDAIAESCGFDKAIIDKRICEGIDARDNGITIKTAIYGDPIQQITFPDIVSNMNPSYDEDSSYNNERFIMAVEMAYNVLDREIRQIMAQNTAKQYVRDYINEAKKSDNPDILIMDTVVPWKTALLEMTDNDAMNIKAVVYKSPREGYQWMLAPVEANSFKTRVECPEHLKGLRGEQIKEYYEDGLFIHPTGFTGGAETQETCIKMLCDIIDKNN